MKLNVIIEKNDTELWGRIEGRGNFMPIVVGETTEEVLENLRDLIVDYLKREGKQDKAWLKVNLKTAVFELYFDVQAFFQEHDFLKQSQIAKIAHINPGLLRQYSSGVKHPSPAQAKRIESAIHKISSALQSVSLYALTK